MMTLYRYAGEWRVASSKRPAADGAVRAGQLDGDATSLAQLFWRPVQPFARRTLNDKGQSRVTLSLR